MKITALLGLVTTLAISVSAAAQTVSWSSEYKDTDTYDIGGGSTQRPTISSVVFNHQIYIAYTSTTCTGNSSGCRVEIRKGDSQRSDGGFSFSQGWLVDVSGTGPFTFSNPALAVQNGIAYLAWTDESGANWLSSSTDMVYWSAALAIPAGSTTQSVTLIPNPSNLNQLSLGYLGGSGTDANGGSLHYYPAICSVSLSSTFQNSTVSCYTTTQVSQMNFNPGLAWSGSNLYLFQEYRGSSHCLSSFYSTTGSNPWTYWNSKGLCGAQQTSSAPSSVFYNGYLYVAYRSNDSADAFDLVGGSVTAAPYYSWSRLSSTGTHMDGAPDFLPVTDVQTYNSGYTLYSSELINFYARGGYLYSTYSL